MSNMIHVDPYNFMGLIKRLESVAFSITFSKTVNLSLSIEFNIKIKKRTF